MVHKKVHHHSSNHLQTRNHNMSSMSDIAPSHLVMATSHLNGQQKMKSAANGSATRGQTNEVCQTHLNGLTEDDFVTVVEVTESSLSKDEFVTVVQVGQEGQATKIAAPLIETIVIYRNPGERLGMALKFEGGTCANEKIEKVYIQNINKDSPASKASGKKLGQLREGDQILKIEGRHVVGMTRIECVNSLRDAATCISMSVKRIITTNGSTNGTLISGNGNINSHSQQSGSTSPTSRKGNRKVPPPVPPRLATTTLSSSSRDKLTPSSSSSSNSQTMTNGKSNQGKSTSPSNGMNHNHNNNNNQVVSANGIKKKQPPPLPPRRPREPPPAAPASKLVQNNAHQSNCKLKPELSKNHSNNRSLIKDQSHVNNSQASSPGTKIESTINNSSSVAAGSLSDKSQLPAAPEIYVDLLTEEAPCYGSDTDDTGSSVSTIISRFSRTSTANSSFSDVHGTTMTSRTPTIDIERVLGPFERLEQEFDQNQALNKFVTETTAALREQEEQQAQLTNGVNEQLLTSTNDILENDYDDIQSVSMGYDVNLLVKDGLINGNHEKSETAICPSPDTKCTLEPMSDVMARIPTPTKDEKKDETTAKLKPALKTTLPRQDEKMRTKKKQKDGQRQRSGSSRKGVRENTNVVPATGSTSCPSSSFSSSSSLKENKNEKMGSPSSSSSSLCSKERLLCNSSSSSSSSSLCSSSSSFIPKLNCASIAAHSSAPMVTPRKCKSTSNLLFTPSSSTNTLNAVNTAQQVNLGSASSAHLSSSTLKIYEDHRPSLIPRPVNTRSILTNNNCNHNSTAGNPHPCVKRLNMSNSPSSSNVNCNINTHADQLSHLHPDSSQKQQKKEAEEKEEEERKDKKVQATRRGVKFNDETIEIKSTSSFFQEEEEEVLEDDEEEEERREGEKEENGNNNENEEEKYQDEEDEINDRIMNLKEEKMTRYQKGGNNRTSHDEILDLNNCIREREEGEEREKEEKNNQEGEKNETAIDQTLDHNSQIVQNNDDQKEVIVGTQLKKGDDKEERRKEIKEERREEEAGSPAGVALNHDSPKIEEREADEKKCPILELRGNNNKLYRDEQNKIDHHLPALDKITCAEERRGEKEESEVTCNPGDAKEEKTRPHEIHSLEKKDSLFIDSSQVAKIEQKKEQDISRVIVVDVLPKEEKEITSNTRSDQREHKNDVRENYKHDDDVPVTQKQEEECPKRSNFAASSHDHESQIVQPLKESSICSEKGEKKEEKKQEREESASKKEEKEKEESQEEEIADEHLILDTVQLVIASSSPCPNFLLSSEKEEEESTSPDICIMDKLPVSRVTNKVNQIHQSMNQESVVARQWTPSLYSKQAADHLGWDFTNNDINSKSSFRQFKKQTTTTSSSSASSPSSSSSISSSNVSSISSSSSSSSNSSGVRTIFEDSGVFLEPSSPSPESSELFDSPGFHHLQQINNIISGGKLLHHPSRIERTNKRSNSLEISSSSSDTDPGVTSMSSDSMDESDSASARSSPQKISSITTSTTSETETETEVVVDSTNLPSVRERIAHFQQVVIETTRQLSVSNLLTGSTSSSSQSLKAARQLANSCYSKSMGDINNVGQSVTETVKETISSQENKLDLLPPLVSSPTKFGRHFRSYSSSSPAFSEPPLMTSTPNIYSGHLEPSYKRFTSYESQQTINKPNISPSSSVNMNNSSSILSTLIESRKQNSSKLKGLIIPEKNQTSQIKDESMPTIVSSKTVELLSSSSSKMDTESSSPLSRQGSCSSNGSSTSSGTSYGLRISSPTKKHPAITYTSVTSSLYEPPFATLKNTIPKYSPAFKRRALEISPLVASSNHPATSSTNCESNPIQNSSYYNYKSETTFNLAQSPKVAAAASVSGTSCQPVIVAAKNRIISINPVVDTNRNQESCHEKINEEDEIVPNDNNCGMNETSSNGSGGSGINESVKQFKELTEKWKKREQENPLAASNDNNYDSQSKKSPILTTKSLHLNLLPSASSSITSAPAVVVAAPVPRPRARSPASNKTANELKSTSPSKDESKVSKDLLPCFRIPNETEALKSPSSPSPLFREHPTYSHLRMSSMDSSASGDSHYSGSVTLVPSEATIIGSRASSYSNLRDSQYGSVTSLASTTSLISPQELQQLIDDANSSLDGEVTTRNIQVVVLNRDYKTSGAVGLILAGGVDCETREITVHKVITGSIADRDGRIKKGDRVLSINGKIIKGATHREALDILKSPRSEVVLVLSRPNGTSSLHGSSPDLSSGLSLSLSARSSSTDHLLRVSDTSDFRSYRRTASLASISDENNCTNTEVARNYKQVKATLVKDGAGLGFILEGGKDSPLGDRPLAIKKIFKGGLADKEGSLIPGDEILTVNDESVQNMTRTEAWNHLKKLPDGPVNLLIRRVDYGH